ncbi:hypothetical protein BUALT_Bualt04G0132200 [Buddleja alternifolia]|uniref:Uncharacterized protein n=1 Tax=Buddleja alternifolia TaxID=168488 RepID=A0AAV6XNJ9_9LAMI|nr:hypothetical protein BUALT_Bualt04G0132200 [Buddleja alternifolia]
MFHMGSWGTSGQGWRKGPWTHEEDKLLIQYVSEHGDGLNRSGKSCRLRWVNYLRPGLKKGHITPQEEGIIIELHALWGNKWSTIARYLPGRTDNEIKNYWRTHFKKRKPASGNKLDSEKFTSQKKPKQGENSDDDNIITSPDQEAEEEAKRDEQNDTKLETEIAYKPNMENGHHFLPMIYQDSTASAPWSDNFVTFDSYLWGGLWNLDDQNCCAKTAVQNQTNVDNCSRGGDAVNYMYTGGYIF